LTTCCEIVPVAAYATYEAARFASEVANKTVGKIIEDGGVFSESLVPAYTVAKPVLSILEKVEPINFVMPIIAKAGFSKVYHGAADAAASVAASVLIPTIEIADRYLPLGEIMSHPVTEKIVQVAQAGANVVSGVLAPVEKAIDVAHNVVDALNPVNYIISDQVTARLEDVIHASVDFVENTVPVAGPILGGVRNFVENLDLSDAAFGGEDTGFVEKFSVIAPVVETVQGIVDAVNPVNYVLSDNGTGGFFDVARGVLDSMNVSSLILEPQENHLVNVLSSVMQPSEENFDIVNDMSFIGNVVGSVLDESFQAIPVI